MSIKRAMKQQFNILFTGNTARIVTKDVIEEATTKIKWKILSIAPNPTVTPPRHPIIKIAIEIIPNRLNSDCLSKILSQYLDKFEIMFLCVKLNESFFQFYDVNHIKTW